MTPPRPSAHRLDASTLTATLVGTDRLWSGVSVTEHTTSTNADAARAARDGAPEGSVFTTELQRTGRGRLDRAWVFVEGASLAVSVVLRPQLAASTWVWLPLLAGLAVDATVRSYGVPSELKWPNDVQVDGRKIAGILLERVETHLGPAAIVGVGLNVSLTSQELPTAVSTSLVIEGATTPDRADVLTTLLDHLEALYREWVASGGDASKGLRDAYLKRCITVGQDVTVQLPDGNELRGPVESIDDHGRVVIADQPISAGDITHIRPADGA